MEVFGATPGLLRPDYSVLSAYVVKRLKEMMDVPFSSQPVVGVISLVGGRT